MHIPRSSVLYYAAVFLVIILNVGGNLYAQLITRNQFIVGYVEDGTGSVHVMLPPGQLGLDPNLTFFQKSFFSCLIGSKVYSNKNVGFNLGPYGPAGYLSDGHTQKINDTIRCIWTRDNIDIIQDIYPVAFERSGQIVYKFKFLNHASTPAIVQCQFLLDIEIGDQNDPEKVKSNDGPIVLTRWGYHGYWQQFPSITVPTLPWFFIAFLHNVPNAPSYRPGLSGMGYIDYKPLGLIKPINMIIGDWTKMIDWNFGISPAWPMSSTIGADCAVLNIFAPIQAPSNKEAEGGRTSYGTGEFEICEGNIFGLLFYPHRMKLDAAKLQYIQPNPFNVEFYAFDANQFTAAVNTSITLTVGNNLTIVDTPAYNPIGKTQTLPPPPNPGELINAGDVHVFDWWVKADPAYFCMGDVTRPLKLTGTSSLGPPTFVLDTCEHDVILECAEKDIDPPIWSVLTDTNFLVRDIHVHDDRKTDRGLKEITWHPTAKRDSANFSNFGISYSLAIKPCATDKDIHTVHIVQMDSTIGGCFDFTYEDCVGNKSFETVCLPAHPVIIIPDTLKPDYHIDLHTGSFDSSECNSRLDSFDVRDDRLHDKGLDSVFVIGTPVNMIAVIDTFPKHSPIVRFALSVIDTMKDGAVCIRAIDGAGNYRDTCIFYCTIHDTLPPIVTIKKDSKRRGKWTVNVSDNRPWDRLIDSVFIVSPQNITFPPTGNPPSRLYTSGQPVYSFIVTTIDTMKVSSFCVKANDLAGNMSDTICTKQGIDTDSYCPNINVSPDPKTSPTSITVFVDDIHFDDAPVNKDTNIWDTGIDRVWFTGNTGILTPDTIRGNCLKRIPPFTLSVLDTLKIDTLSCVIVNARDCHGNTCSYTWCYPYIGDSLPPILKAHYVGHDSIAVQVSDSRIYDRGLQHIHSLNEINLSTFDTTATDAGLWLEQFGLTRPKINESTFGSLHAVDIWGSHTPNLLHQAFVNFAIWVQDFEMKKGTWLKQGASFSIPVYFAKNDTFPVASKGITDFSFSFQVNGPAGAVTFDSVSTVKTETANWNVAAKPNGQSILITGTMLPKGKPLVADLSTNPPDSLVLLYFSSQASASTRMVTLDIDSIVFNNGRDTTYFGLSATAIMPPPWGSLTGSTIAIVGSCSPIITSDSALPSSVSLDPNRPNPFSHMTTFDYTVAEGGPVRFAIYDVLGKEIVRIVDAVQKQGTYSVKFDGSVIVGGSYIARLETGGVVISRMVAVVK